MALDIGTYSIKVVNARVKNKKLEIVRVVEVPNTVGMSIPNDEISKEKLSQLIQAVFTDNSLPKEDVRLALPESAVSTKVIQVPLLTDAELASAIGWQAEQFIPIPKDELALEYQVLFRPEKNDRETPMRVLLIGVKKTIVEDLMGIFSSSGMEPTFIETQTIALWRSIHTAENDPVSLVAHMGLSTLDISIERAGELAFIFSHPQGGMLLTRAVENMLTLPIQQAEEYKRTYGLDQQYFQGKVQAALLPVIKSMVEQIQKAMQYYTTQFPQEAVQRVYLSGGSAQLPGFVSYAASLLGVEVQLVTPFSNVTGNIPEANQAAYSVCMGLVERQE
ncbi:MAG: type IV pilus assembly protein PilM [Patescibacteria group bacterium]